MGDPVTRRRRHELSIRHLDTHIGRQHATSPPINYDQPPPDKPQGKSTSTCLLTSSSKSSKTILDSGASRHIEVRRSSLTNVTPCPRVILQGINGDVISISTSGPVGHCHNVLLAPQASASVRSVSAIIDSHLLYVVFTSCGAFLVKAFDTVQIAKRKSDGLFHVIRGSIPPASPVPTKVPAYLSVPQQIKREAVHELHRTLGHACPRRMHQSLTDHPEINTSLKPSDTRLFTSCDDCEIGNTRRPPAPEKATTRATAFSYRVHFDTSGTIRPSTSSGFTRVLIGVDEPSRWAFVTLLRAATMDVVAAAMRSIVHSVLRIKYVRTDNGTEFCNRIVDALLAKADIMRELTCVGTSHQNGVAERPIGVVFAVARTIIIDACLPPRFWGETVIVAAYVRNRLPSSANANNRSPYEVRYGRRPDLRHLRLFGITTYVRIKKHITKVQPRDAPKGHSYRIWRIRLLSKRLAHLHPVAPARHHHHQRHLKQRSLSFDHVP